MTVRLLVKQRSEQGGADKAEEVLLKDPVITLGRDPACQVVLAQQAVSRSHARISRDGALFFVEDLGSAYGTHVNNQPLPKGEKRLLRNGDVIAIAQFDVTFDRVAELPKDANDNKTSRVARHVVKDVMRGLGAGEAPYFRVMNGPKEGQKIEVADAQELVVGRDAAEADVVLEDDLVSRKHAKIRRDWSGTHVEDLESRNGIKVNKKRVNRKTLRDRDELEVGGVRLLYLDPADVREAPVVLTDDDEVANTGSLPPVEESPPVAGPEPQAEPAPAEAAAEPEPVAPEPEAEQEYENEEQGEAEAPAQGVRGLMDKVTSASFLPVIVVGALGLVALVVLIALIVGA
ncbi:MAG: FHA domain-containing protein [Myxococcaceae bacterium]